VLLGTLVPLFLAAGHRQKALMRERAATTRQLIRSAEEFDFSAALIWEISI